MTLSSKRCNKRNPVRACKEVRRDGKGVGQTRIKQLAHSGIQLIMGMIYLSYDSLCDDVQLI